MKKLIIFLTCIILTAILSACELPEDADASTAPSSAWTDSSAPETAPSVPEVPPSSTGTDTSAPSTQPASQPGTSPSPVPDPNPNPAPVPEPDTDNFRENFMAVHNAGQKHSFAVGSDTYEISLNPNTCICTVWHRTDVHGETYFPMGPISYQADNLPNYSRNYYYIGTYEPDVSGNFKLNFDHYYLDVDLSPFSASTIEAFRKYVWDNLQNQWNADYCMTQAECEMWDSILDGNAEKDICRWINTMEISGTSSLPLQLMYYYVNGEKTHSYTLTETQIKCTSYFYSGYTDTVYAKNGKLLYRYTCNDDGSCRRSEYDDQERLRYEISTKANGSYTERTFVWNGDIQTATTCSYVKDKIAGLYRNEKVVEVNRYDPANPSMPIHVSSHTYDKNDKLIKLFLYNTAGNLTESLIINEHGIETHKLCTYEGNRLLKTVETVTEGPTTTTEYIYTNGQLHCIRTTVVHPDGYTDQWEDVPSAALSTPN